MSATSALIIITSRDCKKLDNRGGEVRPEARRVIETAQPPYRQLLPPQHSWSTTRDLSLVRRVMTSSVPEQETYPPAAIPFVLTWEGESLELYLIDL